MAKARGTKAMRTKSGGVSAAARRKHGQRFPVFDQKSALSALKLRGHAASKKAVVNKVSAYATKSGNATVKAAVKRARAVDKAR